MTTHPDPLMPRPPVAPSGEKKPEFFVARAVCAEAPHRVGWISYDVETPAGVRSE